MLETGEHTLEEVLQLPATVTNKRKLEKLLDLPKKHAEMISAAGLAVQNDLFPKIVIAKAEAHARELKEAERKRRQDARNASTDEAKESGSGEQTSPLPDAKKRKVAATATTTDNAATSSSSPQKKASSPAKQAVKKAAATGSPAKPNNAKKAAANTSPTKPNNAKKAAVGSPNSKNKKAAATVMTPRTSRRKTAEAQAAARSPKAPHVKTAQANK